MRTVRSRPWTRAATLATRALRLVPVLVGARQREYRRLLAQARHRPGWWNRRLQPRAGC
ncbi:hypothetical protein ACI79D_09235 [Geodermatophilus sp. SYSU D00708]